MPSLPLSQTSSLRAVLSVASLAALPLGGAPFPLGLDVASGVDDEGLSGAPPQVGSVGQGHPRAIILPKGFGFPIPCRRLVQVPIAQEASTGKIRLPKGFGPPFLGRGEMGDPHRLDNKGPRRRKVWCLGGAGRSLWGHPSSISGRFLREHRQGAKGLGGKDGVIIDDRGVREHCASVAQHNLVGKQGGCCVAAKLPPLQVLMTRGRRRGLLHQGRRSKPRAIVG